MKRHTTHFLFKLVVSTLFFFGNYSAIVAASSEGASKPETISSLIGEVTVNLREAANAANLVVRTGKGEESERKYGMQLSHEKLCFQEIDNARSNLKKLSMLLSSGLHQNISGSKGAEMSAALVASGGISEHLRDVEHSGILALRRYLKEWKAVVSKPKQDGRIRCLVQNDIEQKVLADKTDPDLMSCVIFWDQLQHSASPALKEFFGISRSLEAMQARCVMIVGEKMSSPQRVFKYFSVIPEYGSFFRKITDALCLTKSDEEQIQADRTFANEFLPMIGRRITELNNLIAKVKPLQRYVVPATILRREELRDDALEPILYNDACRCLSNARAKLLRLQALLRQLNKNDDTPEDAVVKISTVYNVLVQSESNIADGDMKLRQATVGWTSVAGLTYDQRKNLTMIRSRKAILPNAFSGLYDAYATIVGTIREILPQGDLSLYRTDLTNYLKFAERTRTIPTVVPYQLQPKQQSLRADMGWFFRYGVPSVIPSTKSAFDDIGIWTKKFELARTIFGQQLEDVVKEDQWLWPMRSLDNVGKSDALLAAPIIEDDCHHRKIGVVTALAVDHGFRRTRDEREEKIKNDIEINIKELRVLLQPSESNSFRSIFVLTGGQMSGNSTDIQRKLTQCHEKLGENLLLTSKVSDLREICSGLLTDDQTLQAEHDLKQDGLERAQSLLAELRRNVEKYASMLDSQIKRSVSREEGFDSGEGLGSEDKEYKADSSLQDRFIEILNKSINTFCKSNDGEDVILPRGWSTEEWYKRWKNYFGSHNSSMKPMVADSFPTVFVGVTQVHREQAKRQYEESCNKYNESVRTQDKLKNDLYKYSWFKRISASFARWRGWSWGGPICSLKNQLPEAIKKTANSLNEVKSTYSNYRKYFRLCYAARESECSFYMNNPTAPKFSLSSINSSFIANKYFSIPLDNR